MVKCIHNFFNSILCFNKKTKINSKNASQKVNPYELIWYRQGWPAKRIAKNNAKFWQWENDNLST
jgi:hypothetical protein